MITLKNKILRFFSSHKSDAGPEDTDDGKVYDDQKESENLLDTSGRGNDEDRDPDSKGETKDLADNISDTEINDDKSLDENESDVDWENRVLCSDGNCIGIIGPDSRCKECGKPYEGEFSQIFPEEETQAVPEDSFNEFSDDQTVSGDHIENSDDIQEKSQIRKPEEENAAEAVASAVETEIDLDLEWEQRQLCSDGSCIGVIGPDGRCKECGKPYEGSELPFALSRELIDEQRDIETPGESEKAAEPPERKNENE